MVAESMDRGGNISAATLFNLKRKQSKELTTLAMAIVPLPQTHHLLLLSTFLLCHHGAFPDDLFTHFPSGSK